MKRFLWEASYVATVVLLTIVLQGVVVQWAMDRGAVEERGKRRNVADSLLGIEMLRHNDSIFTEVSHMTIYRLQWEKDSIVRAERAALRARRAACGPMLTECK